MCLNLLRFALDDREDVRRAIVANLQEADYAELAMGAVFTAIIQVDREGLTPDFDALSARLEGEEDRALLPALLMSDLAWAGSVHFQLDTPAYIRIGLVALALMGGSIFYSTRRAEPEIAAMLAGTSFLCAFSGAASVLNCFLLTLHGLRLIWERNR